MLEIFLSLVFGIIFGVVAGLMPGLHPNNTIPIIVGMSFLFSPLGAAIVLVSSGIINIFVNFIPSIILGAPEDGTVLSVLPGHKMLMEGRGFEAIKLSVLGGLGGILFSILILPVFAFTIPPVYELIRPHIHFILIPAVVWMLWSEKKYGKLFAILTFFASGFLGLIVLDYSDAALFPLLSGLFGLPTLLIAIWSKTSLPKVFEEREQKMKTRELLKSISIGSIGGIIAGLLPGLGSAQSTALTQQVFREKDRDGRKFLISIGAVSSSDLVYSLLALYLIGNPRSGIAVAVSKLIEVGFNELLMLISVIIISTGLGVFLTLKLTRISLKFLKQLNYSKLCLWTLIFIYILIFIFSGPLGLIIGTISMFIGLIPNYTNIRRTHSMGCLLLPTILWFTGINLF